MRNQAKNSESTNQTMASEPSREATIGMELESERSASSSEVSDSVFLLKYSNVDSSNSASPISISNEINDDDNIQIDTNVPEKSEFWPIDPAPRTSTNNEANEEPTARKITTAKSKPNAIETRKPLIMKPSHGGIDRFETQPPEPISKAHETELGQLNPIEQDPSAEKTETKKEQKTDSHVIEPKDPTIIDSPPLSYDGNEDENLPFPIESELVHTVNEERAATQSPEPRKSKANETELAQPNASKQNEKTRAVSKRLPDRSLSGHSKIQRLEPSPSISPLSGKQQNDRAEGSNRNPGIRYVFHKLLQICEKPLSK